MHPREKKISEIIYKSSSHDAHCRYNIDTDIRSGVKYRP